jgi:hypothetical protein
MYNKNEGIEKKVTVGRRKYTRRSDYLGESNSEARPMWKWQRSDIDRAERHNRKSKRQLGKRKSEQPSINHSISTKHSKLGSTSQQSEQGADGEQKPPLRPHTKAINFIINLPRAIRRKTAQAFSAQKHFYREYFFPVLGGILLAAVAIPFLATGGIRAASAVLVPNSDVTTEWPVVEGGGGTHYGAVDEGVTPDTNSYIGTGTGDQDGAGVQQFGMETASSIDEATSITLNMHVQNFLNDNNGIDDIVMRIIIDGSVVESDTITPIEGSWNWYDITATGSWSQSDIDSMEVSFEQIVNGGGPGGSRQDDIRISTVYVDLEYEVALLTEQSSYRWFENEDDTDGSGDALVSNSLTTQDTPATAPTEGTPFRLRATVSADQGDLPAESGNFKLQYAELGPDAVCTVDFSGGETYIDVEDPPVEGALVEDNPTNASTEPVSPSSTVWSNPGSITDQDPETYSHVNLEDHHEESLLFAEDFNFSIPSNAVIDGIEVRALGEREERLVFDPIEGEIYSNNAHRAWLIKDGILSDSNNFGEDFPQYVGGAPPGNPEWRTAGSDSALWGMEWAPEDINSNDFGVRIRARHIHDGGGSTSFYIEESNSSTLASAWDSFKNFIMPTAYAASSVSAIYDVEVGITYSTPAPNISFYNNENIPDGSGIASSPDDPDPGSGSAVLQSYVESNNFTNPNTIPDGDYGIWDFALVDNNASGEARYCFRIVNSDGSELSTYTVIAELDIPPPTFTQGDYRWYEPGEMLLEQGKDWSETESISTGSSSITTFTDHLLESESGDLFWSFGSQNNHASLYRSTDGGVNWSEVESVNTGNNLSTDHLIESSTGDLFWSFGGFSNFAYLYRSTDGGASWSEVESVNTGETIRTDHLLESESGDLFWSFGSEDNHAYMYRSTDGGVNWSEVESVTTGDNVWTDHLIESSTGDLFWSFGGFSNFAYLYRSTDGGASWSEVESVNTGETIRTDHLLESESGDLFWSFGSEDNHAYMYRSTDGGVNWSEVESVTTGDNVWTDHLIESSTGDLFWSFGGNDNISYLYRSTDGGASWSEVESVNTGDIIRTNHLLGSESGDLFWSFGSFNTAAYLYRSTDGGASWSEVESVSTTGSAWTDHLLESSTGDLFWSFGLQNYAYLWRAPVVLINEVGDPLASQNEPFTLDSPSQPVHLRMLMDVDDKDATAGDFKLQYAPRIGDVCSTDFTGYNYQDVGLGVPDDQSQDPGSGTDTGTGGVNWSNPSNITSSNEQYASVTLEPFTSEDNSTDLYASDFGFDIPSGVNITGVEVTAEIGTSPTSASASVTARLNVDGEDSDSKHFGEFSSVSGPVEEDTVGGPGDLWDISSINPEDVNDAGFGVKIFATTSFAGDDVTVLVDYVTVTVHYSDPSLIDMTFSEYENASTGLNFDPSVDDPTSARDIVNQVYVQSNDFSIVNETPRGATAMFDFSIYDNSQLGGNYCFRIVNADGSLLDNYAYIAELGSPPRTEQLMRHGRWFDTAQQSRPFYW